MKSRWGGLIAAYGLIVGVCWLLAMVYGVMGRGYDFPYVGLGPGIGIATGAYWKDQRDARATRKSRREQCESP